MDLSAEDTRTGLAVTMVIGLAGLAAGILFARYGWAPGRTPVAEASRPEVLRLAATVWSVGFGLAACVIGTQKLSSIPVTLRGFGIALLIAVILSCSNWIAPEYAPLAEEIRIGDAGRFLLPSVIGFGVGFAWRSLWIASKS